MRQPITRSDYYTFNVCGIDSKSKFMLWNELLLYLFDLISTDTVPDWHSWFLLGSSLNFDRFRTSCYIMRAGVISTARKQKITANTIFRLHLKLMCECFVVGPPVIILLFPTLGTAVLVETRYLYNNKEYIDYTSSCSIASEISVTGLTCIAGTSCYDWDNKTQPAGILLLDIL